MNSKQVALFLVVIVALAVIFVPMRYEKRKSVDAGSAPVKTMKMPKIKKPALTSNQRADPLAYQSEEEASVPKEPEDTEAADDEKPMGSTKPPEASPGDEQSALSHDAWVIQVASFSDGANAQTLVEKLRSYNYHAFSQVVEHEGQKMQRVYIGPTFDHVKMFALASQLQDELRLSGVVVNYQPS